MQRLLDLGEGLAPGDAPGDFGAALHGKREAHLQLRAGDGRAMAGNEEIGVELSSTCPVRIQPRDEP